MQFSLETETKRQETRGGLVFSFWGDKLLVKTKGENIEIPSFDDLASAGIKLIRKQYLGRIKTSVCYSAELAGEHNSDDFVLYGLRQLYGVIDEELFWTAGRAFQIMDWDRTHLYCGHCGTPTETEADKYAKVCPKCGLTSYPRISPAMIVAVVKDNQILLARNKQRPFKFYSVLAGFVEPGESLEDCVRREVEEEVGIRVKNIRYFGSQPWPFPHSLMVAFIAEYEGGQIEVDENEIADAAWFTAEELPEIPGRLSIARSLIDWFIEYCK